MSRKNPEKFQKIVYQEFNKVSELATERGIQDLPPNKQNLRINATRAGRKGKTVTVITGFQHQPQTLKNLLKQLKSQCGGGGTIKENTIEIQGEHKQKILKFLRDLGYQVKISGG